MKRNIFKVIAESDITTNYDLTFDDMFILRRYAIKGNDLMGAMVLAFQAGYVLGHRATVKGKYKEATKERAAERLAYLNSLAEQYCLNNAPEEARQEICKGFPLIKIV